MIGDKNWCRGINKRIDNLELQIELLRGVNDGQGLMIEALHKQLHTAADVLETMTKELEILSRRTSPLRKYHGKPN